MRFRYFWPILDPDMGERPLMDEARADLERAAAEIGVHWLDLSNLRWSVEGGCVCVLADYACTREPPNVMRVANVRPRPHPCERCGTTTKAASWECPTCERLADAEPVVQWRRHGLIWRAA